MDISRVKKVDISRRDDGRGCKPCPFSESGKGAASDPVYQDPPSANDPECFSKMGEAFLSSLDAASPDVPRKVTLHGCRALAALGDGGQIFNALYELDKTHCGLGPIKVIGDDPNVNSILTNCSNEYGIANLDDPGWPSSTYQCTLCTFTEQVQTATTSSDTSSTSISAPPVDRIGTTSQSPSPTGEASSSTSLAVISTDSASTTAPFLASLTPTTDDSLSTSPDTRIPTQGIVAIVVCTTLAISAALTLLFCVLRRRRKQQGAMYSGGGMSSRMSRITAEFNAPDGGDTYEPLISPSHSLSGKRPPPLTPPPRLRDRKLLLPPLLRPLSRSDESLRSPFEPAHHHQSSSSLYSPAQSFNAKYDVPLPLFTTSTTAVGRHSTSSSFLSSPICAPRANDLEPRPERMQAHIPGHTPISLEHPPSSSYTRLRSPPPVSFTFPPRSSLDTTTTSRSPPPPVPAARQSHHRRGTPTATHHHKAYSSTTSTTKSDTSSAFGQDHHHHPLLLHHSTTPPPRRPLDAAPPLEIPDLVRPDDATTPAPLIGVARTTPSISLQSLAGRRDSWGSWEGEGVGGGEEEDEEEEEEDNVEADVAGRMFGVSFPPARRLAGGGSGSE